MVQPPPPGQGAWPPYQHYPPPQYSQPYYPQQRYGPPPKKPKWPWFLAIGLVLALVAAAGVVLLPRLLPHRSTPTTATGTDATGKGGGELRNVPRKGYGEQSDGVADPDFRAVFNRPAAPFVEEELATAVGRVDFSINTDIKDRQQYAYVETTCKRLTGDDSVDRYVLTANVTSYTADAAATNNLRFGRAMDVGRPVGRQVGEEAYCVTRKFARSPGTLVFRKGRFVVALTLSDPKQPEGSADPIRRCGRLTGVAGQMIGRMRA